MYVGLTIQHCRAGKETWVGFVMYHACACPFSASTGVHNTKAEEYDYHGRVTWQLARDRMRKQFSSYLLPFLMNTTLLRLLTGMDGLVREDGWHTAAIATVVRM
jgi:hypothetical protein